MNILLTHDMVSELIDIGVHEYVEPTYTPLDILTERITRAYEKLLEYDGNGENRACEVVTYVCRKTGREPSSLYNAFMEQHGYYPESNLPVAADILTNRFLKNVVGVKEV